ncbi:RHS repeat-associated core domain-containing protein, partial [Flavobacterium circumlabens]
VLEIIEENNYYPFGLKHKGYNEYVATGNKYKYNGKELQDELSLNLYDYGARFYDPATGRWYTVDAMAEKFSQMSPYNYAVNNPVIYVDPDGNEVEMCCDGLKGLLVGLIDNVAGTNIRSKYGGSDFNTGTKVADMVSIIGGSILTGQGMADMTGGAAGLDASVTATAGSGGLAIEVSGPAAVVSTGLIAKGALEVTVGSNIVSNAMSNLNESGKIYKVPGTDTKSGEPYIGRTQQSSPKKRGGENAKDGRNRTNAEVIDTYDPSKKGQGAYKEQKAIDKNGGVKSLDNKRNEASPERMKELKKKYGNGK